jgi:hypothetical protein
MTLTRSLFLAASILSLQAHAASTNLVTNGDFELNGGASQIVAGYSYVTGWTSGKPVDSVVALNFVIDKNADTTGFSSPYRQFWPWGPGKGVANGFTGSHNGGYFIGNDGSAWVAPLYQQIDGLTAGKQYAISFEWAQSQLSEEAGATTSGWSVSLGSQTLSTGVLPLASRGFSGWKNFSGVFTATGVSETLSFLAVGSPYGLPPFALLDGVSLTAVPEPGTLALMLGGFGIVGAMVKRSRRAA